MSARHESPNWKGYSCGHPWYYFLGGPILSLRQIRTDAESAKFGGYRRDQIEHMENMAEPKRSQERRKLISETKASLAKDISRYRQCVRDLRHARLLEISGDYDGRSCRDIDVSMSLKVSHIFNEFCHLKMLDEAPQQFDLFG